VSKASLHNKPLNWRQALQTHRLPHALEEFPSQPPTKKLSIFKSVSKILKISEITIIESLIANISLLFSIFVVVVSKFDFGQLGRVGG
jgi:hypothetical protein